MAIVHVEEIRDMTPAEREAELEELETELLNAKSVQAAGGAPDNPGRTKELRRTIARIKTIQREEGDPAARSDAERSSGDEPRDEDE
jgi:large subunit ribosomal protein L29